MTDDIEILKNQTYCPCNFKDKEIQHEDALCKIPMPVCINE